MATKFVELDEVCALFPPVSANVIARLIARAAEREIREQRHHIRAAVLGSYPGLSLTHAMARHLAAHLGKSLRQRGASPHGMPSIRHKSPTSGGRPFHFAHSVVVRGAGSPTPGAKTAQPSKAAAHMTYVERAAAVEKGTTHTEGRKAAKSNQGWEREVGDTGRGSSASASQGYVENPQKLASDGNEVVFSFGNIGETFAERTDFWLKLEMAETRSNARIQNRLILELPHEATPAARYEMVQAFCARFERDGVPYWAALHAPGKKNDSRNFHAHVVFSERPAKRMVDQADGQTKWDFEITTVRVYSNRTKHVSRPHRQNKIRFYSNLAFIPTLRQEFAAIVNGITTRDNVRDKDGDPVCYDPRSYQDMGVDVVPMRSIERIVSDKLRRGKLTILDNDYTKKMITQALQAAAAQRDAALMGLYKLEQQLRALAAKPGHAGTIASMLEPSLRPAPGAILTSSALKQAAGPLLAARREACVHEVITRTTRATLDRIIEASNPRLIERSQANTRDPVRRDHLPDPETMEQVHREACAMRDELEQDTKGERLQITRRMNIALGQWQALVQPKAHAPKMTRPQPGPTSPIGEEVQKGATPQSEAPDRQQAAAAGPEPAPLRRAPITMEIIREASKRAGTIIASFREIPDLQQRVDAMRQYPVQRAREKAEARSGFRPPQAQPPRSDSEPPREEAGQGEAIAAELLASTESVKHEGADAGAPGQAPRRPKQSETDVSEMDVTDHLTRKSSPPEDLTSADHHDGSTSTAADLPSAETHVFAEDEKELDENVAKSRGRGKQDGTPPELEGPLATQPRATVEQERAGRVGQPGHVDGHRPEGSGSSARNPRDDRRIVVDAPLVVDEISVEVAGGILPRRRGTSPGELATTRPGQPPAGSDQPVRRTDPDQPSREPDVQHGKPRNGPDRHGVIGKTGESPSRESHLGDSPAGEPAANIRVRSKQRPGSRGGRVGNGLAD